VQGTALICPGNPRRACSWTVRGYGPDLKWSSRMARMPTGNAPVSPCTTCAIAREAYVMALLNQHHGLRIDMVRLTIRDRRR